MQKAHVASQIRVFIVHIILLLVCAFYVYLLCVSFYVYNVYDFIIK